MKPPSPFTPLSPWLPGGLTSDLLLRPELLTEFEYLSNTSLKLTFGCNVLVPQPPTHQVVLWLGIFPKVQSLEAQPKTVQLPGVSFWMHHQQFYNEALEPVMGQAHFQLFGVFQHIEASYLSVVERTRKTDLRGVRQAFPRRQLYLHELQAQPE
jgi:hypothetical protein